MKKKRNDNLISTNAKKYPDTIKYDMAIGLFYGVGIFLGIGIFFVGGFMTMSGAGWGASLFGGGCFSLVFGLICHAVITLRRNDK